jgi:branched-chain amino acid transport system ATP-binding protein
VSAHLLEVRSIGVKFGGVTALEAVDLSVEDGSIHGLIGPNGAGKTTLLNAICRIVTPQTGTVLYGGRNLLPLSADKLAALGIVRTFQNLVMIEDATVLDNVRIGLHASNGSGILDDLIFIPRRNARERAMTDGALQMLRRLGLQDFQELEVRHLPYGTRKMVELARALAARPRLLLLDEPTAGLNDVEIARLQNTLLTIRSEHQLSILVITHHVEFLIGMADTTTVLDLGRVIASDTPQNVRNDPRVVAAYLGAD